MGTLGSLVVLWPHSYTPRVPDPNRRLPALDRPILLYLGLVCVAIAFGLPLCRRAIILSDEGYILQQALDLLDGRVLYRDMDAFITPGMWFAIAGAFAIAGPSVLVSRVLILAFYVALMVVGYRIVLDLTDRRYALCAVAGLLLFSVWAFPAWTFAFYSPAAVFFALFGLERLLAWSRSAAQRDLFFAGFLFGLSICFKQNYGAFALVGASVGWIAIRVEQGAQANAAPGRSLREIGVTAAGAFLAGLPFLVYLLANDAMPDAWQSLVVHPFEFGGKHDIPFAPLAELIRPDVYTDGVEKLTYLSFAMLHAPPIGFLHPLRIVHRMHALAYWIAPVVLLLGALAAVRMRGAWRLDGRLVAVLATCGMLFLGVFPRADFNHLVNVYQPILVALPIVLFAARRRLLADAPRARLALTSAVVLLSVLYGGVALYWYSALIRQQSTPLTMPRGGVLVGEMEARNIEDQIRTIVMKTDPGDALLTLPDLTMLNFLSERDVPSAYYNLYEHHITHDDGAAVVAGSEERGVTLAMTRYDNFFSDRVGLLDYAPVLSDYLVTHFERSFVGGNEDYIVYERRAAPLAVQPFTSALADCTLREDGVDDLRHHLLFSTLYHRARPNEPIPEEGVETVCRIDVPESGGVLSLEVGYRKPRLVKAGTTLSSTLSLRNAGERTELFQRNFRVVRRQGNVRQSPYARVEVDLTPWSGQRVDLIFETALNGVVMAHPLDFKGFAMVYRDPRIQTEPGGAHP